MTPIYEHTWDFTNKDVRSQKITYCGWRYIAYVVLGTKKFKLSNINPEYDDRSDEWSWIQMEGMRQWPAYQAWDNPFSVDQEDIGFESIVEAIEKLPNKNKIIIDKATEFCSFPSAENLFKRVQKKYPNTEMVITFNDNRNFNTDLTYFPSLAYWYYVWNQNQNRLEFIRDNTKNEVRNKLFISRNMLPKQHRLDFVEKIKENGLIEKGIVSRGWEDPPVYIEGSDYNGDEKNESKLIDYYNQTFTEVVMESDFKHDYKYVFGFFDGEKSFRPFLMCQIPLIFSFPNFYKYLRIAGFDMFDDVIDTSFDTELDYDKKMDIIIDNVSLVEKNCTSNGKFKDEIWKRLKKNQEHFLDLKNYYNYWWSQYEFHCR
ncbi:hypothetical protein CMI38_06510 [Candidatus Pacearchaeota archaeon]|jgi:hypothetical protein|nr:hypothetical protein [Candidatus Pacearchaeota archaeon]|tara:strand:+ start:207 stop:1322 length:1116 start_codon:yes stop_codon:yes gene_type:complete